MGYSVLSQRDEPRCATACRTLPFKLLVTLLPQPAFPKEASVYEEVAGRLESYLESSDDSYSGCDKRARNKKDFGRAHTYYVGNQSIIKAWRKAQSKMAQLPPVLHILPSDDIDIHIPSNRHSLNKAYESEVPSKRAMDLVSR